MLPVYPIGDNIPSVNIGQCKQICHGVDYKVETSDSNCYTVCTKIKCAVK